MNRPTQLYYAECEDAGRARFEVTVTPNCPHSNHWHQMPPGMMIRCPFQICTRGWHLGMPVTSEEATLLMSDMPDDAEIWHISGAGLVVPRMPRDLG